MSGIQIVVRRDSVCAGDDIDAPHEKRFWLRDEANINEVFRALVAMDYLPSIAGSRESWEAHLTDEVIFKVGKNFENPEFLVSPLNKVKGYVSSNSLAEVKLVYFAAKS